MKVYMLSGWSCVWTDLGRDPINSMAADGCSGDHSYEMSASMTGHLPQQHGVWFYDDESSIVLFQREILTQESVCRINPVGGMLRLAR